MTHTDFTKANDIKSQMDQADAEISNLEKLGILHDNRASLRLLLEIRGPEFNDDTIQNFKKGIFKIRDAEIVRLRNRLKSLDTQFSKL